jgi:hypothetical protein
LKTAQTPSQARQYLHLPGPFTTGKKERRTSLIDSCGQLPSFACRLMINLHPARIGAGSGYWAVRRVITAACPGKEK